MRHCVHADLETVAEIFSAGFVDDPWFRWLWPGDADYATPDVPHFACVYVAVQPQSQGRGVGEMLMRRTLQVCDADGFGAHLVSTNERNLSFYRRNGFEVTAELPVAEGAVTFPAQCGAIRQLTVDESHTST